jgi:hypothetical protein
MIGSGRAILAHASSELRVDQSQTALRSSVSSEVCLESCKSIAELAQQRCMGARLKRMRVKPTKL